MATVNKDFKIKSGLIVEGTTATVNGYDILTKKTADQNYIIGLIGGSATSEANANAVVLRDGNASFAANVITADLVGDVTGQVSDISNHNTDDLSEGATNKYYSDSLVDNHLSGGDGINYSAGQISTNLQGGGGLGIAAGGKLEIDRTTVDGWYDANGAAANAQSAAESYAATQAGYAQGNAEAYADGLASNYDAVGSAANALADANDYTDTAVNGLSSVYDALGSADTAYNNAIAYAEGYTDNAVAALVDSAPEMLDTLNELAQALQDNPNVIADLQDVAAGKQDTLTVGNGIEIDANNLIYIPTYIGSGISATPGNVEIDRDYVDAWYDASGAAANAQSAAQSYADTAASNAQAAAEDYADSLAPNYDAAGSAANALADANDYTDNAIANLDLTFNTDEISEGATNEYFTDARAKSSAADLLTGASLTNITITGSGAGLTITAENGVADSDTDDLTEGTTNLYFTDSRALDAVSGSNIQPESIDITWVRREEATWTNVATASKATCHSASTSEGSMKYLVRVTASVGGTRHSHVTEVLATVDGSNGVAVVEYGTIYTSAEPLATVTVEWNATTSEYDLNVTTANNNSEVMVAATLMAVLD